MAPQSKPHSLSPTKKSPAIRKSRLKYDFSLETLKALSHYRQDDAAGLLNVAPITLKRICQRRKYRWPYRTIKAKLRREALANQKKQARCVLPTPMKTTPSPLTTSLPIPELLLSLRSDKKNLKFNSSPTSVSEVPSSTTTVRSPTTHFPLLNEPKKSQLAPQLPPLTFLLKNLQVKSTHATPPHFNYGHSIFQHSTNYKSSFYSASFLSTDPMFPTGRLSTLANQCDSEPLLR